MEQSDKQSGEKKEGHDLSPIRDKFRALKESPLFKRLEVVWMFVKFLCVVAGIFVIYKAARIIGSAYTAVPSILFESLSKFIAYFTPLFLELIVKSLKYLWQPILVYVFIAVFTKSKVWRRFWCLVGVAGFLLLFISALKEFNWPVLGEFSWSGIKEFSSSVKTFNWEEFRMLPLLLIQGYLFALWLLPREVWNVMGLVLSSVLGLIILISPADLPTAFDDFGMFGAILAFFLGYLNALASLLQRAVSRL